MKNSFENDEIFHEKLCDICKQERKEVNAD